MALGHRNSFLYKKEGREPKCIYYFYSAVSVDAMQPLKYMKYMIHVRLLRSTCCSNTHVIFIFTKAQLNHIIWTYVFHKYIIFGKHMLINQQKSMGPKNLGAWGLCRTFPNSGTELFELLLLLEQRIMPTCTFMVKYPQ